MAKEFYCKYKMNSPMTGCKASIVVKRNEEDALIIKYKFSEVENDYKEDGQAPVSEDIIKEVRDLVNRHMVSLKVNMVPGSITDTADESFEVDIDGRCHIFKSENLVNMTNDATVEEAWVLLIKYLPEGVGKESKIIFGRYRPCIRTAPVRGQPIRRRHRGNMEKTNPMRHLDKLGIPYTVHHYGDRVMSGMEVAEAMGQDPNEAFKTLVTVGKPKSYHVFVVPVSGDLDLKKAAASVGEKSVSMIKQDELLPLTGYVHGGCSPLCIKRPMTITIDASAQTKERIYFSAGKVGYQIEVRVEDLPRMMDFSYADIRKPRSDRECQQPSEGSPSDADHGIQGDVADGGQPLLVSHQINRVDREGRHGGERSEDPDEQEGPDRIPHVETVSEHQIGCDHASDDVHDECRPWEFGIYGAVDGEPHDRADGATQRYDEEQGGIGHMNHTIVGYG